jgi:ABC-2 type transport system permease protein
MLLPAKASTPVTESLLPAKASTPVTESLLSKGFSTMLSSFSLYRTGAVAQRVLRQLRHDHRFLGLSLIAPLVIIYLLKVMFQSVSSPFFDPAEFIVAYGAFIVHFLTYVLTTIVLVRERTANTLSRMFINGYGRSEVIGGYLLGYTLLASLQSLLVLTELRYLFELDYTLAQFAAIYLVMWLLAIISMALGIFISNFARNEGQVFPFIPLVILPSIFLSGILISVEKLAEWAQWLSRLTPLYYANEMLLTLIKPDGAISNNWSALAGLILYGTAVLLLANLTLREVD